MKKFSQMTQRVGNRFKQRLVPFFNGVYSTYAKLRKAVGNPIVIDDASDEVLQGLRIFGKSTQDGTPTPTAPVEIVSVENPTVNVDEQTLSVPYPLRGIPVTSGGNYTDSNGQQWICDEVDFERGVYVQRIGKKVLNGIENWQKYGSDNSNTYRVKFTDIYSFERGYLVETVSLLSNYFEYGGYVGQYKPTSVGLSEYQYVYLRFANDVVNINSVDELTTWLGEKHTAGEPVTVQYPLNTPIETPLTADQIEAYKVLHTNKPNTTIRNDQNAWMEVEYIKS